MSSSAPSALRMPSVRMLLLCAVAAMLAGCPASHPCDPDEKCDYVDNDCDGRVDEGLVGADGVYSSVEDCGACGVRCADVFPHSEATRCEVSDGRATCDLIACEAGFHPGGDGACVPDVSILCTSCADDGDCEGRGAPAKCENGLCFPTCSDGSCPEATVCADGVCMPEGGDCSCNNANLGLTTACWITAGGGQACAGARTCGDGGFGACTATLSEECNGVDDDCDDHTDEDFQDADGVYNTLEHCGACATPCVAAGPNMIATCDAANAAATCNVVCASGFVDVDGIAATGCECERWDGTGPPPAVGVDADCDGVVDDSSAFVYVTTTGSDANEGTLVKPMRTIPKALLRGSATGRDVLVARGVYDGAVNVLAGVSIFGGYRADFRDRNLGLYPVVLERSDGVPGQPVLTCTDVTATTRIEGLTVVATAAARAGDGSTAVYSDDCDASVTFAAITVLAARGATGSRGKDSSDRLAELGLTNLGELAGTNGTDGRAAPNVDTCPFLNGGAAGLKTCPGTGNVSGGQGGSATCADAGCVNGSACGNAGCTDFTVGGVCDIETALMSAVPNPPAGKGRGSTGGEAGALTYDSPTNRDVCNFCDDNPSLPRVGVGGKDGGGGNDGNFGLGCASAQVLVTATGQLRGGDGEAGTAGENGSGGGGGTAGAGFMVIGNTAGICASRSGGSGGGGGSGGCGAPGTTGGGGGGSSVGVLIRVTHGTGPVLEAVRVVTASGGRGGDGGVGASGGAAGYGGVGGRASFWCSRNGGRGGNGGPGGDAGGAGGGCGGSAHGVVVVGGDADYTTTLGTAVTVDQVGVPGQGGRGGTSPGAKGTKGGNGAGTPILWLP